MPKRVNFYSSQLIKKGRNHSRRKTKSNGRTRKNEKRKR
jgi:hypothetical protein